MILLKLSLWGGLVTQSRELGVERWEIELAHSTSNGGADIENAIGTMSACPNLFNFLLPLLLFHDVAVTFCILNVLRAGTFS